MKGKQLSLGKSLTSSLIRQKDTDMVVMRNDMSVATRGFGLMSIASNHVCTSPPLAAQKQVNAWHTDSHM